MKITMGRLVHYTEVWDETREVKTWPAIVIEVNKDGSVNLRVFERKHDRRRFNVREAAEYTQSRWTWPPRV